MKRSYLFIALGAALWGIIGIFLRKLEVMGLTPLQIAAVRVVTAFLFLLAYILCTDRSALKIKLMDLRYFLGTGVLSIGFFNYCYFTTIRLTTIATAVILLYTAPAFVTILSLFLF